MVGLPILVVRKRAMRDTVVVAVLFALLENLHLVGKMLYVLNVKLGSTPMCLV